MKNKNMEEEELTAKLKRFENDTKWLIEHYDELKIEYPEGMGGIVQQ